MLVEADRFVSLYMIYYRQIVFWTNNTLVQTRLNDDIQQPTTYNIKLYAQILRESSQEPVQRAVPGLLTPKQDTRFS